MQQETTLNRVSESIGVALFMCVIGLFCLVICACMAGAVVCMAICFYKMLAVLFSPTVAFTVIGVMVLGITVLAICIYKS